MNYYINYTTKYKFCKNTKIAVLYSTSRTTLTIHRQVVTEYKV